MTDLLRLGRQILTGGSVQIAMSPPETPSVEADKQIEPSATA